MHPKLLRFVHHARALHLVGRAIRAGVGLYHFSPLFAVIGSALALTLTNAVAVPFTQTFDQAARHVFSGSSGAGGEGANITTVWTPIPPLEPLDSMMVLVTFSSDVTASNPNPLGFPLNNTFIVWSPVVVVTLPDGTSSIVFGNPQQVSTFGPGTVTASGQFRDTLLLNFTGPSLLGPTPIAINMDALVDAGTQFGDGTHDAMFTARLVYNVPEYGGTLLLIAPVLALLFCRAARRGRFVAPLP